MGTTQQMLLGRGGALVSASLLHFEGADASTTFTDVKGKIWTANGNAQIDTAQFQFGAASGLFDGTGDYITTPNNSDFEANTDFTCECWIRPANVVTIRAIASKRGSPASGWQLYIDSTSRLALIAWDVSTATLVNIIGTTPIVVNTWHAVAFTRQSNTWRIFVNGNLDASAAPGGTYGASTAVMNIGRDPVVAGRDFSGHIDEFRVTNGTARYTSNYTPSGPFPDV